MLSFKERVLQIVSQIPKGRVVSYGQVAAGAGSPRAARQVGGILAALPDDTKLPWWRVINNHGVISIKGSWIATKDVQKQLLEREKITVDKNFTLDIEKYRHQIT